MATCIFAGHVLWIFDDSFPLAFAEIVVLNAANECPENIKAIGRTGRTNLLKAKIEEY